MLKELKHITIKTYNMAGDSMFRNYLKIAFRNLAKNKVFTAINVAGLAIGVTCFLALFLLIRNELGHDSFNPDYKNIYRVYVRSNVNGVESVNAKSAFPLGKTLKNDFPEVITYTTVAYDRAHMFKNKEREFREWNIYWTNTDFFKIFPLEFISGDPNTALDEPYSIVLTQETAKKYFGNEDPVGKMLESDTASFKVTGVVKGFPKTSHFSCAFLGSSATFGHKFDYNWLESDCMTYIELRDGTSQEEFQNKLTAAGMSYIEPTIKAYFGATVEQMFSSGASYGYYLQPISSIYLYSQREYGIDPNTEWGNSNISDASYVYIFSAVAVFILLLAIVNFMNLATARSEKRSKEVGIRKTLGSDKKRLIYQFIIESSLMSVISVAFALCLLELILPYFNLFIGRNLNIGLLESAYAVPSLLGFALLVGLLAGSYPAFYLSSFAPAQALKPSAGRKGRKSILRSSLVIFQFSVSIILLIGTLVIRDQLNYMQTKDLGFKKDNLVMFYNIDLLGDNIKSFKDELLKNPQIMDASASFEVFRNGIPGKAYLYDKVSGSDPLTPQYIMADNNFLKTYQIKLAEGRYFSQEFVTDTSTVVINETMDRMYGLTDPIGKSLTRIESDKAISQYKIIGIIKDFNYESLHQQVRPLVIHYRPGYIKEPQSKVVTARILPENAKETIAYVQSVWKNFVPDENLYYDYVEDNLASLYDGERKIGIAASAFSFLAIFIACLGLFGLAAFVTEQRTKEIGIRKVLGASLIELLLILSKDFAIWTLIANIIAWPAAYYLMQSWLDDFAYRVQVNLWLFLLSGTSALFIAMLTLSMHTVKAALANPVKSLRYE